MAANPPTQSSVFASLHRKSKAPEPSVKENRDAAVREAKQYIRDVVRNDWAFEPPATLWSSSTTATTTTTTTSPPSSILSTPATATTSNTTNTNNTTSSSESSQSLTEVPASDVVEWRLREYASSGSEFETDSGAATTLPAAEKNPYRFESPDAIQESLVERRRKRRAALEEEAEWNPGLRFFLERRNAWTGVKKRKNVSDPAAKAQQQHDTEPDGLANGESSNVETKEQEIGPSPTEMLNDLKLADKEAQPQRPEYVECYESDDSLIPVMGPFIPDSNCIRSSITPAIYASIYSKVILQGLTPTVPINLSDVTKAIVAGWKADGQWPPKITVPPPGSDVPVRKKGHPVATNTDKTSRRGSFGGHGSGVANAVKKVLGLSGHSFHLRRLSRSSTNGEAGEAASTAANGVAVEVPVIEETGHR
ncbi:hypothetical protein PISL3812_05942 [Talaromyces islandicus]|uniref:Gag1-like clamp domain-containing protein n=1 Tax=Talaromyces islandicus TaxID=28573 RepID=A0A0U1M028_TALIS|nr:hypothetical protein PISL3812_05942 [Talaromyces islandicus]